MPVILQRGLRLAIPLVVGEIIAGIIVGRSGFNLIADPNPWLDFLKTFGFAYLMFLSGLEVDFDLLRKRFADLESSDSEVKARNPVLLAFFSFALTLALSLAFAFGLAKLGYTRDVLIMALIFSTTSLGVVMPVLKERGVLQRELGQQILIVSVVGDFATVTLIGSYVILHTDGLTFDVLLVLVLLAATFFVYRLARLSRRHMPLEKAVEELSHATGQLDTRWALALAVVFIALAQRLGVEAILGAFLAGSIVSLLSEEEGSSLRYKLNALGYGFFIPIFFIMVGVQFDLQTIIGSRKGLVLVPMLLAMAYVVKLVAALVYRRVFSWRETAAVGILTSARLSLIIAVATIGVEIGAITPTTNAAVILVSIATVILSPVLFNQLVPAVETETERVLIVAGSRPHGRLLAQRLQAHGEVVTVVSRDGDVVREAEKLGLETVRVENHRFLRALEHARVERARTVLCLLDDEAENERLSLAVRRHLGVDTVIAHVESHAVAERMRRAGIRVVEPGVALLVTMEALVRNPHAFSILTETEGAWHVQVVTLRRADLDDRQLSQVRLPEEALVMVIARQGEVRIPRGHTRLRLGDRLTLVGSKPAVEEAAAHFRVPNLQDAS